MAESGRQRSQERAREEWGREGERAYDKVSDWTRDELGMSKE